MVDSHGNGPHWCGPLPSSFAAWAEAEVDEGYRALREPMIAAPLPFIEESRPEPVAPVREARREQKEQATPGQHRPIWELEA